MSNHDRPQPIIACHIEAIPHTQRDSHISLGKQLFASVQATKELANGYAFRLPSEKNTLYTVVEWVSHERLCCPFFTFTLQIGSHVWLVLSGEAEVKAFIRETIFELIAS